MQPPIPQVVYNVLKTRFYSLRQIRVGFALILALIVFLIYVPSLHSELIYDARAEILKEGFITSPSNIAAIFSPHILSTHLMLATRPGHLLYLMLIARMSGRHPFGYHLGSNLLHSFNIALLFILLVKLSEIEINNSVYSKSLVWRLLVASVCLIFAVHPINVESVSEVSFSSTLLVTFFSLLTLIIATYFPTISSIKSMLLGTAGVFCCFASVTCKESGIATPLLLLVYWILYRYEERNAKWVYFLVCAILTSGSFLVARFYLANRDEHALQYLGGSFFNCCQIQPRIWVFMIGQILWPLKLSADYTPENITIHSNILGFGICAFVLILQLRLVALSRLGALGVATYWLGLATVSNFIPLYRFLADRFYYLPLIGCAMQLVAIYVLVWKMKVNPKIVLNGVLACCLIVVVSFTTLTSARQRIFVNDASFWRATVVVSPSSPLAHNGIAIAYLQNGQYDKAICEFESALKLNPHCPEALNNLGSALARMGRTDEALIQYVKTLELCPDYAEAHNNLGLILFEKSNIPGAISHYERATQIDPFYDEAYNNLGIALFHSGHSVDAENMFFKAIAINPNNAKAYVNLGSIYFENGQIDDAVKCNEKAIALDPNDNKASENLLKIKSIDNLKKALQDARGHDDIGLGYARKGKLDQAIVEFQKAIKLSPYSWEAHTNMGDIYYKKGEMDDALDEFNIALQMNSQDEEALISVGNILLSRNQISKAVGSYQLALKIDPSSIKLHNNLGVAYASEGDVANAIVEFKEALRLDPSCVDAKNNLNKAVNIHSKEKDTPQSSGVLGRIGP